MKLTIFIVIALCYNIYIGSTKKIDVKELRCLVCKASLDELNKAVNKIDPSKKVDIGGYRLDPDGNYKHKSVSQAKSEIHLSELIEEVCSTMDDYVRATWKSNGTLTLLKLITEDGNMNSAMSEVDIVQDDDLNKSLKYYCEGIMEEEEEHIIKHFQIDSQNIHRKVCVQDSAICEEVELNS
ncbi:canopy -like 1, partial [Asbolus verrucosus]